MNGSELFDVWAPADAVWSRWAKPVLFAEPSSPQPSAAAPLEPLAIPDLRLPLDSQTAVIVDLPGARSVQTGLALARQGYRPVPLFNGGHHGSALVSTAPILSPLQSGAAELARRSLSPEAPPAFLLDALRLASGVQASPGMFDNRWIVFPQDFPSANYLRSRNIRRVLLLAGGGTPQPAADLAHVLLRWQEGGLELFTLDLDSAFSSQQPLKVVKPSGFRQLWYATLAMMGLRRSSAGGFGAIIPAAAAGGGFG